MKERLERKGVYAVTQVACKGMVLFVFTFGVNTFYFSQVTCTNVCSKKVQHQCKKNHNEDAWVCKQSSDGGEPQPIPKGRQANPHGLVCRAHASGQPEGLELATHQKQANGGNKPSELPTFATNIVNFLSFFFFGDLHRAASTTLGLAYPAKGRVLNQVEAHLPFFSLIFLIFYHFSRVSPGIRTCICGLVCWYHSHSAVGSLATLNFLSCRVSNRSLFK